MYNIRSKNLQALQSITLPDSVSKVDFVFGIRDMGDYDLVDRSKDAHFELPNGINLHYSASNPAGSFEITTTDTEIIDATKWLNYNSYKDLVNLFNSSLEYDMPRDIDRVYFDMFKSIIDAVNGRTLQEIVSRVQTTGQNTALFDLVIKGKDAGVVFLSVRDNGGYELGVSKFINTTNFSSYDLERSIYNDKNSSARAILGKSMIDVAFSLGSLQGDYVSRDTRSQVLDERPDHIIYTVNYDKYFKLPLSCLDDLGIKYGFCFYSNQPIITDSGTFNHGGNLSINIFGSGLPRLADSSVVLSSMVFYRNVGEEYCQDCDSSYDVIDYDFYHDLINSAPEEHRSRIQSIIDDNYTTSDSDNGYCSHCENRHEDISVTLARTGLQYNYNTIKLASGKEVNVLDGSRIQQYDYHPDFYLQHLADESDSDLHLGVEIEIDKGGENNNSARIITAVMGADVYAMHDGSLSDGFEMATMPATLNYHMNYINYKDAFDVASALGYRAHDTRTCGLHVHINRRFFGSAKATQGIKAAFMTLILERNWSEMVKFSRRDYHHIEEWANARDLSDDVYSDDTDSEIVGKFYDKYDDKYVAVNTQHSSSFEIRIFRGTLRYETYIATLQFVSNLAHIAKECTTLTRAQQITFDDIVNYNRYPELVNYLATRGMQVESDTMPVLQPEPEMPTLFSVEAQ